MQTGIADKAFNILEKSFDGELSVGHVHIQPFNTMVVEDLLLLDDNPQDTSFFEPQDTIFYASSVVLRFTYKGLTNEDGIQLRKAEVRDGVMNLVSERPGVSNITRTFRIRYRTDAEFDADTLIAPGPSILIKKVKLRDFNFTLHNSFIPRHMNGHGIEWSDLDVLTDLDARNFRIEDGYYSGIADKLSFKEKSGFEMMEMSGEAKVGRGRAEVKEIHIDDGLSDVYVPLYVMNYRHSRSFKYFTTNVSLEGLVGEGRLYYETLSYFTPLFIGMEGYMDLSYGKVNGPVNDLNVSRLSFTDNNGNSFDASCHIKGATEGDMISLNAVVRDMSFTTESLQATLEDISLLDEFDISSMAPGSSFNFRGEADGPLNELTVKGELNSDSGHLNTDLSIKNLYTDKALSIDGNINTVDLNIGHFLNKDFIGECSLSTKLNAVEENNQMKLTVENLAISRLNILDYNYSGVAAAGTVSNNEFNGRIICSDPHLNFLFQGIFSLSQKTSNSIYRFYFNLGYADLNAINLDPRGTSRASMQVRADFINIAGNDLLGDIELMNLTLQNDEGNHDIGNINISSQSNNNIHRMQLNSNAANIDFVGKSSIIRAFNNLKELTVARDIPSLLKSRTKSWNGEDYRLRMHVGQPQGLLSFFAPGVYIAEDTDLSLDINQEGGVLTSLKSQRIAYNDNYIKDINLSANNYNDSLNCNINCSEIRAANMSFLNDNIRLGAWKDSVYLALSYDDNNTESIRKGNINIKGSLMRDNFDDLAMSLSSDNSEFYYDSQKWDISDALISYIDKRLFVDDLVISNDHQSINLHGAYSPIQIDTMIMGINNIELGLLSSIMGNKIMLYGLANGTGHIVSPLNDGGDLVVRVKTDSTSISGYDAGSIDLAAMWDESRNRVAIRLREDIGEEMPLLARGFINPGRKEVDLDIELDDFNPCYLSPFVSDVFSELNGSISGDISIEGGFDNLKLLCPDGYIDNTTMRVAFTNVPYTVNGAFSIDNSGLSFDDVAIKDRYDGTGTLSGGIAFSNLSEMEARMHIDLNRMEAVNIDYEMAEPFYGNIFASGALDISGPFNNLELNLNGTTDKAGSLHVPLNSSATANDRQLLVFKEAEREVWVDPYEQMLAAKEQANSQVSGLALRTNIAVTPDLEMVLEIDKASGNTLSGSGSGNILIDVVDGDFSINGDYSLVDGNYHFAALGLTKKDFSIQNGSSIKFNGDIMNSDLDINAVYSTKASLSRLIADTTSVSLRRTVNCLLHISDKLRNPQLSFDVEIPDLDPTTKSRVESALNTNDKVQKQFLALLVSNSFLPDEQSGIVNSTDILFSNVSDIMSGQLNNILNRLDIPLDLGLDYLPNEGGTDIFDVAVSTQMFNNRVIVNGAIGNRDYGMLGGSSNEVVGDLDIEIKMDKSGSVRLSLFSHSADQYTNYLDYSQRNGIGVTYQKEFYTVQEFLKDLFAPRAVRDMRNLERQNERNSNKVTINIDKDD